MGRVARWIEAHNPEHANVLWGLIWSAANIGLVVLLMALVSST